MAGTRTLSARTLALVIVAAVVLVTAAAVVAVRRTSGERADQGPLEPYGRTASVGMIVDPGQPYSIGTVYVTNTGRSDVTITDVYFEAPTAGLEVVGVLIADPQLSEIGTEIGFPPHASLQGSIQAIGAVIRPGQEVEFIVGFRVRGQGSFTADSLGVSYESGAQTLTGSFPGTYQFCASTGSPDQDCPSYQVA